MTETYAYLIKLGVEKGYCVIPEFPIPTGKRNNNKIDLVFARKKDKLSDDHNKYNLNAWEVHYAIEIDGVDAKGVDSKQGKRNGTFMKHAFNYAYLFVNQDRGVFKKGINVLYYNAYHRTNENGWKSRLRTNRTEKWKDNLQKFIEIREHINKIGENGKIDILENNKTLNSSNIRSEIAAEIARSLSIEINAGRELQMEIYSGYPQHSKMVDDRDICTRSICNLDKTIAQCTPTCSLGPI